MKIGADNKVEYWAAVILGICALASVGYWIVSSQSSTTPAATRPAQTKTVASVINPLDPTLRLDLLKSSEDVKYESKGRNIFRAGAEPVEIPKPVQIPIGNKGPGPVVQQGPPQPPPPPPINLKFFGVASRPGEQPRILLSSGDSVFVAHEGDIVNRRYKIVKINPQSVEVEDLLNNNRQSIPLTQG